jgi:hypothetical protein
VESLKVVSGDTPKTGEGSFAGHTYPHSIIYELNNSQDNYQTDFALNGQYKRFQATVGISQDANVHFQALADSNHILVDQTAGSALTTQIHVDVDVSGARILTLKVSLECCVTTAIWGDARVS